MIQVFSSKSELVQAVTENIVASIKNSIHSKGVCFIALAGGNTPRVVYARLATPGFRGQVQWQHVHLFWGDERTVPPDHPDSNYGMVKKTLLNHITIPEENIHRIRGEIEPKIAASEYAHLIQANMKSNSACFDLILLGLGEDGHTASLFPGTEVLNDDKKDVTAVFVPKLDTWRITLTLPVFNQANEVIFLVSGTSKAEIVKQIMKDQQAHTDLPALRVLPKNGIIRWMLDAEAAALINT